MDYINTNFLFRNLHRMVFSNKLSHRNFLLPVIALLLLSASCSFAQTAIPKDSLREKLIGTWQVNKITTNGKEDPENNPTNKDVLILNADGSHIASDHSINDEQRGPWSIEKGNVLVLEDSMSKDKSRLKIVSLTSDAMQLNVLEEGNDVIMVYLVRKK